MDVDNSAIPTADATGLPAVDVPTSTPALSGCGASLPRYVRKGMTVEIEYPEDMDQIPGTGDRKGQLLSAEKAYQILKNVSDDDVKKLGLDPEYVPRVDVGISIACATTSCQTIGAIWWPTEQ